MRISCYFLFLAWILFDSCSKEKVAYSPLLPPGCDSTTLIYSYIRDVKPIIGTNCAGPTCHVEGTGNYDFTTYEVLSDRIRSGHMPYVLLLPANDVKHMPQTGPPNYQGVELDPCDLYKILKWIEQGYPNN